MVDGYYFILFYFEFTLKLREKEFVQYCPRQFKAYLPCFLFGKKQKYRTADTAVYYSVFHFCSPCFLVIVCAVKQIESQGLLICF